MWWWCANVMIWIRVDGAVVGGTRSRMTMLWMEMEMVEMGIQAQSEIDLWLTLLWIVLMQREGEG